MTSTDVRTGRSVELFIEFFEPGSGHTLDSLSGFFKSLTALVHVASVDQDDWNFLASMARGLVAETTEARAVEGDDFVSSLVDHLLHERIIAQGLGPVSRRVRTHSSIREVHYGSPLSLIIEFLPALAGGGAVASLVAISKAVPEVRERWASSATAVRREKIRHDLYELIHEELRRTVPAERQNEHPDAAHALDARIREAVDALEHLKRLDELQ